MEEGKKENRERRSKEIDDLVNDEKGFLRRKKIRYGQYLSKFYLIPRRRQTLVRRTSIKLQYI